MNASLAAAVVALTGSFCFAQVAASQPAWASLPDYPISVGVSGAFVAAINGDLVVGGGSAFPDAPPWRGGTKTYYSQVSILRQPNKSPSAWESTNFAVPQQCGYGVTIATDNSVILIGGCDNNRCFDQVEEIRWADGKPQTLLNLPLLPATLAYSTGALVGDKILIAGGQSHPNGPSMNSFFCLDLARRGSPGWNWQELPSWPGPPRAVAVSCAVGNEFYLFSGRNILRGLPTQPLVDAYCYDAVTNRWRQLRDLPHCIMGGSAVMDDQGRVVLLGGDDGQLFSKLENLRAQIASADDSTKAKLTEQLSDLLEHHAGFSRSILRFDPKANRYDAVGEMPPEAAVTTAAVRIGQKIILPVGEIRPGIRSAKVWSADLPE